ncbi:MAG: preprotein translocase subunit SecA [Oscillospiraceae bacterium]|nr:preprotein translocase subunit SecA [Oscillospiraceae bacterium]
MGIFSKVFGSRSDREVKRILPTVERIEALQDEYRALSDAELKAKTDWLKGRLADGETLDDILPDAFATVREAADRVLGMRHYKVQLIGGMILHQGRIAEMKTGEGKTLVATLPSYLNALAGKGVHVVTVNDYLARRDSEWMGKVHRFLGLKVGLVVQGLSSSERRAAYAADITYGTNNELGFDYLRDNMALYKQDMVQRGHVFAIVDEVDSILIDEARTPLIISGQGDASTDLYRQVDHLVRGFKAKVYAKTDEKAEEDVNLDADYVVDEKAKVATLTARGTKKAEHHFNIENLADLENSTLMHHISQAIRAYGIMHKDVDYVVRDGEVIIVDEFTGRLMVGRRYSQGLHQAIEAKEGVTVEKESKTLATITFQNYFRMYAKLSGMTGTAMTEQDEFVTIYSLDIVEIPTNRPLARIDLPDVIYKSDIGKHRAIIQQIMECHEIGQPVLVGTVSIEKSELLSKLLAKEKVKHNVLNAKNHEKEAEIVAQAGKFGAVTIATNMAGRGTDIMLGGNAEYLARHDLVKAGYTDEVIVEATGFADTDNEDVKAARKMFAERLAAHKADIAAEAEQVRDVGGLFILGTERHESRRIDNQLRGRAGRQGDPGESKFYLAATDDLIRIFAQERFEAIMERGGFDEDTPLEQKIFTNLIENAQRQVESRNFQSRKQVLEYDDVMNRQRELIYKQRQQVLDGGDIEENVRAMIGEVIEAQVAGSITPGQPLKKEGFAQIVKPFEGLFLVPGAWQPDAAQLAAFDEDSLIDELERRALEVYDRREKELGTVEFVQGQPMSVLRELERIVLLRVVDEFWMDHIDAMQELRQGIGLRAYAQQNPVDAYKREGFEMFDGMIGGIKEEVVRRVFTAQVRKDQETNALERKSVAQNVVAGMQTGGGGRPKRQPVRVEKKVGRNEACPCGRIREDGSPIKYKNCCGKDA